MKCPLALSLRVTPIPSRTTPKSTRPRASDRPMGCQPGNRHGLPASEIDRRPHYSIRCTRWKHATRPNTSSHAQGLKGKEIPSPSSRGRKMSLTSPLIDHAITLITSNPVEHRVDTSPLFWPLRIFVEEQRTFPAICLTSPRGAFHGFRHCEQLRHRIPVSKRPSFFQGAIQ
jgi:hypothetical protein